LGEEKMVDNKCLKCDAEIPEGSKFCPNCAAPVKGGGIQRVPQPMQGVLELLFSKTFIILGISFGILLVWIGNIIFTFGLESMFKGELGSLQAAGTLNSLGFASICLFLLGGGIANRNIDKFVRLLMILVVLSCFGRHLL